MKITKKELRRIIKEEKQGLLREAWMANSGGSFSPMASRADSEFAEMIREAGPGSAVGDYPRDERDWVEMLGQLIDQDLTSRGVWYEDEGAAVMRALESLRLQISDSMRGPTR
tara:strand:- start:52 stop:390 length:339 start_codon:yes stop_codon:yes gene_type:complete